MSSSEFRRITVRGAKRAVAIASVLMLSGCAYFHPAFVTNASLTRPKAETGVLVCERSSLRKADCRRVSHTELREFLDTQPQHY